MRVVVALGGNALLRRGDKPDAAIQVTHIEGAAPALADAARDHELVIVHGNGPQVGLLALESDADTSLTRPYPLGDLVAETQGLIGSWIQRAVANAAGTPVTTLVTQTVVDAADPAFASPTKFVGAVYTEDEARRLAEDHGWRVRPDGAGWRRVVASPLPQEIVEVDVARTLLEHGVTVVLAGGGGVPVVREGTRLVAVEAVVDKDLAAAMVAESLHADTLVLLTDVPQVYADYGTPEQKALYDVTAGELGRHTFVAGSMGPKVAAAIGFVRATGGRAAIGSLDDAAAVIAGDAGTQVRA